MGYVEGKALVPMVVAAVIASIWKPNRGLRGVARVVCWFSLFCVSVNIVRLGNAKIAELHGWFPRNAAAVKTAAPCALSAEDKAALLKAADAAQTAFNNADVDRMIQFIPDALFKITGKDKFVQEARALMAQTKGAKFLITQFHEPGTAYQTTEGLVCFLPRTSTIQFQGKRIWTTAYWVSVRENGDWKFIDGAAFKNHPQLLQQIFPDLSGDIQLPQWKQEMAADVEPIGTFISAPGRVDMVHDATRHVLYITAGDSVLRYDLAGKGFLTPLTVGGQLRGIDLSPDNNLLAVADAVRCQGVVRVHLVDLRTGNDSPASFAADRQESGTYSVAFGADGQLWISSSANGSATVPMRKFNPATRGVVLLQKVRQDTMLAASADRQSIAFAQANDTSGPYGVVPCEAKQLPTARRAGMLLYEIGISRNGRQLAVPTYRDLILPGATLPVDQVVAAAYHPRRDYLFVAQAGGSLVSVYDANTLSKVKDLEFGDNFEWSSHAYQSGRLRFSQDGSFIFCTVKSGIRYAETGV